jgi:hypothetical protein
MSINSPAPGTPQTPTKAVVSGIATGLVIFAGLWVNDEDPFTKKEAMEAFIQGVVGSGLIGGLTYAVRNRPT